MATFTIGLSGSALANTNGSLNGTISDADLTRIVAWARTVYPVAPPDNRTNVQVLAALARGTYNAWINAEQGFSTPAPVPPAPVVIA